MVNTIFPVEWLGMALNNFSWVIEKKLAGSDMPGCGDGDELQLRNDIEFLAENGIKMLVSLARPGGPIDMVCKEADIEWRYFPISDFSVPEIRERFIKLVDDCVDSIASGVPVCVHCHAGIGRTGMVLSCIVGAYLRLDAEQSVAMVRRSRPAIETKEQFDFTIEFLRDYES